MEALEERLSQAAVVPADVRLMIEAARLRHECRLAGHALQDKTQNADLWIAATARLYCLPLVSDDGVFFGTESHGDPRTVTPRSGAPASGTRSRPVPGPGGSAWTDFLS